MVMSVDESDRGHAVAAVREVAVLAAGPLEAADDLGAQVSGSTMASITSSEASRRMSTSSS
jgi:hypothetical protein